MKSIAVYLRKEKLYFHAFSKTEAGVWIIDSPIIVTEFIENDSNVYETILSTLKNSNENIPHPRQNEWQGLLQPLLNAAKVKSYSAFIKSTLYLNVTEENGVISFIPTDNMGSQGFVDKIEKTQTLMIDEKSKFVTMFYTIWKECA